MPDKYLLEHAEQWKTIKLNELHLNIISSISDATISPTNPNWKYWFDREKKTLNVILPAIKSEGELDDIIISGAMSQGGLSTFLSESQLDSLALSVFKACPEALQRSLLGQVLGDSGSNEAKIAAGKRRIIDSAMAAYKTSYKSQESNDWFIIVNNHIRNYLRHVVSFMSLSRPLFANAIGKGIRQNLSRLDNEMTLSNLNASSESLKEIIVELAERERKRLSIDRKRVITLGSVPEILIRYSPRIRHDALLELPLSALYGRQDEESPKRFVVVGVDKTKRDKHPFNLYEIKNFKESLASPLAIFNSTKNRLSTTVMLPNRCEFGNIFVPITRKQNSKNDSGFGRWINTIDSVYPKDALNYIFLLSDKKNTLYVKDGFMEEWLVPAVKNLDDACEKKAKKFGINLPSDEECKKILSEYPERAHYEEENAEGPIKRLLSAVDLNGPSGFLRMYAEYRVALESTTKVVKEFENPKIIKQENIEFSVMSKKNTTMENSYFSQYLLIVPSSLIEDVNVGLTKTAKNALLRLGIESVSQLMSYKLSDIKRLFKKSRIAENTQYAIYRFYNDYLEAHEQKDFQEIKNWFEQFSLNDKCHFLGFTDRDDAWDKLADIYPGWIEWGRSDIELLNALQFAFKRSETKKLISKFAEWKRDGLEKHSEAYRLATEATMYMANKLNQHGIRTVIVSENEARKVLDNVNAKKTGADFSMRDIMNLSYTWNGEEVSMRGFAEQFMSEIKQKDRTMEDAERIAKTFIEAVKADPEKAGMKMLKAENMANAFRFKLPDGTVYTPEHPMAESPEYETQKGLWEIYEHVLGKETMREFIGLLSKNAPMSKEERKRYSELESRVNGSDDMQSCLEVPASKVNENRVKDIQNLIQYFEGNDDYTWTEKALIVKGAMSFGYSEKKEADSTRVELKNISDNNSVSVPVIGGEAAAVVEGLRKGLNFKDALVQARIMLSKESKRSVGSNFTGWKVYKQSDKEEDAVILNQDVAGTGWCTGGAVSTARSHLSGGDFHVYYEAGEPLIAIRTNNGRMAEPPRGAHEGQFCKTREEQIAFDYIRSGNGIIAGDDYIADIEDIRRVMSPNATPLDAFLMPEERRYENGEFGDDTKAWGKSVEQRIAELIPDKKEERWNLGLYYGNEIEHACKNGNAIAIKGCIELVGSESFTLPAGVTQVEKIELYDSASLTLPEGVTQVGNIELNGSASLTLPEDVTQVGSISLYNSESFTLPDGVTQVGCIFLHDSASLTLPESVTQVGGIRLYDSASLTLPDGVTQVGSISLYNSASFTLPEGVTKVGSIYLRGSSSLTLPEGVTKVGDIYLRGSSSLTLPEGVTEVGDIVLYDSASLTLPEGVTKVGNIELYDSASLTLPEGVTKVGDIDLCDSTSLTLPEGVTKVGNIYLRGSSSLTLSAGVTKVGNIELYDSASLTLPEGVTKVGDIYLGVSASLILSEDMTQVGYTQLYGSASVTFPDGFVLKPSGKGEIIQYSAEEMNKLLSEHQKKQEFRLADGTIYGYQQGDTIYLTPAGINPNTPIHEYAHLWAKVYERLRPDEWKELKQELKATPQWAEIANSTSYSFIDNDENRLAGEVLATIVGNKGEELQMRAAKETLEDSSRKKTTSRREIKDAAVRFKNIVTDMAVKDVFDADGMERTGEVTLKVMQDFAKGKGLKIRKEEGETLAAMAEFDRARVKASEYVSKSNRKFNEELQMQIEGKFDSEPHTYNLGYPGPILRSTGIPNLPIQVSSTKLNEKSNSDKHKYNLNEIKDLVKHINAPVAVFSYGDGTLAQNIIIDIEHDNSHFLVGLSLNAHIKGVALEINSIRNVFPKDDYKWIEWIQEGKTRYMDKETIKALLAQQRTNPADVNHLDLDFVANIVEKFENPKVDEKYFIIDNWQYYGVFLDDKSQSIIDREFRDLIPSDWKKYADHITVQYNDYSQDAISKGRALSSELGHEYSAQIVAVGKTDTAIALKVEGIETANKIAHITLAVSPEGRPVDSNKITEWNPVGPIEINGALGLSYKGKKYFHVLDDNEVVDFKIGKHSLNQQETNMDNIYLSDLDRHGVEHFRFEHIMPSRVLRGAADHSVPIHASSKMCDDAGIVGNHNRMGIPVIALRGKEYISVPPGGVYLVEEGKGNYKLLSKEAFDKRFTMVEALRENGEKTLICVRAGTKLNIAQAAAESMDNPNLNSIDILSIDSKTLSKAALFAAWETREDNPYEFVVDLSRTELEDFLKNSFEKLNAEDKEIITNILNKTPGYGEDFVEKRINRESQFNPDIETLLVDDLTVGPDVLDRSMFYVATRNMNEEQIRALRDSVKEKVMAYYAGIEMDAPNASMEKAEADTEKLLNSWFRPWTRLAGRLEYHLDKIQNGNEGPVALRHIEAEARDAMTDERYAPYIERELKGWIRNRCADYGLDYTKLPEDLQFEGAAETYRQMYPEYVKDTKIDTLTRDAILAHIDKITALYPQYPQEPTQVSRKPDGSIVRQYGEFEYEQLKGGFERSKNLVLIEEVDPSSLQRLALYTMSSDSYGEHPNGPYVKFWDNGNIRSYEDRSVRVGSDNEFESDMLSFTREGIVQEKIPGDYPIEPFLEDITKEYMKTMTQREGLEPNATADKIDSDVLSTWFVFLPLEDKMRVFGYYHNNPDVEESPIGFLNNAMDVEKLEKAYKTAVETPFDIPEVDDTVVRVSLEKELNTAFDSLSDASKEQIYRETVAAGIPGIEPSHSQNATAQESVAGSRVYGTLISSLSQAYHEKYKEDGITLEIATTWAQELAVRIEETIGGENFFYPGRIDAESLTNAIGKDYDESDRQLVLDKLSVMLRPFSFSIERTSEIQSPFTFAIPITSDFAFKLNDNHILGIGASPGADMLESFVRQGLGDTSPLSAEEVKGKIDSFASECKVVISLDNSTLEQRPFNDLDVCLDIISMTGMAGRDDRILVKEKSLAGGTIYTVADNLLLSAGVSVFKAILDEKGNLINYSDAKSDLYVSYANDGAIYSVTTSDWGKEGSQPQVKTYYTTQLIVDAFENIKKELPNKDLNQLQEQIEVLQAIDSPLHLFSIRAQSETIPQSRYLASDMLERFDALKSAVSQQMGKELKKFNDAIHLVADNTPNMNLFELEGAFNKINMIEYPFLSICEKNEDVPDALNLARDFKLTLTNLEKAVSQAEKDYEQYLERGERTNNTLLDRLLGRTFTPHFPLPSKAEIEEYNVASDGILYARDSFQLFASTIDPNSDVLSIFNSLLENNQASIEAAEHERVVESKPISLGELTSLPLDYERQLEITGRIDGPVCLSNPGGEDVLVCVQKDGDSLISMRSDDIKSAIDKISSQEEPMFSVNVDGQHYQMRKDNYDSFKYGQGAYAVNAETGEKAYLIFDVKEKKVVKTEKFETVLSKKLQEEKSKADKAMAQSVGQKTEAPTQKRGGGMKKS